MKTPIADFIDNYISSNTVRLHMPGHKGVGNIEKYDITEVNGADVLYSADGIIDESEKNATELFGTAHTYYSTEGSTLAIKAMLAIASKGKGRTVLAFRNVHKAFIYGCALLDLNVEWLYPKEFSHLCACNINADMVKEKLSQMSEPPFAVYVTSPDYLGNVTDIGGISKVCKNAGVPLLVDNAHGAYLKFLTPSLHPMDLGAAMCADSAHKTLPVLTGGAYLHVSKEYPELCRGARQSLSLFASTSPSYLTMRSLDICNKYLSDGFGDDLKSTVEKINRVKEELKDFGFDILESEPLKIVITGQRKGYSGDCIAHILRKSLIECEFCDEELVVLMPGVNNSGRDYDKLLEALKELPEKEALRTNRLQLSDKSEKVLSIRDAVLSDSEIIPADQSLGRICASPTVSCPPAIPIAVSGEIIGKNEVAMLKYYGIQEVEVVK